MIARYEREKDNGLYDRLERKHIEVKKEELIGNWLFVNPGTGDERIISPDEIDEMVKKGWRKK